MTPYLTTLLPIVIFAVMALTSSLLVELPAYPASICHVSLVFVLGTLSWFSISIAGMRRAYGFYAVGTALTFLTLTVWLFPDLWLRWPGGTLSGLVVSQVGALILFKSGFLGPSRSRWAAGIAAVLSLLPLAYVVYYPLPALTSPVFVAINALLLAGLGARAWIGRQRRPGIVSISTLLAALSVISALVYLSTQPAGVSIAHRQIMEQGLLLLLLFLAAIYFGDQLQGELSLRSGPHMSLDASLKDGLTNLANRRALETFGPRLLTQSFGAGRAASVIVCDIDHFKQINDLHGHQAGDAVLKKTAARIQAQVRKSDLVVRYGGEEFVIILPGSPLAPALRLAEKMRTAVETDSVSHNGKTLERTVSFGVASAFPEEPESLADMIARADANLYRAKREGRNRVKSDEVLPQDF